MMKVKIIFKEEANRTDEIFTDVIEVHHGYDTCWPTPMVAIECKSTGMTLPLDQIKEIIVVSDENTEHVDEFKEEKT